jgi:hypothetical protein
MPAVPRPSTPATLDQLASFRSDIDALHDRDVLTPRLDASAAALVAIGAMPAIEAHRASVLAVFGERGEATLDRLVPVAQGLLLSHAITVAGAERDVEAMAKEVMDLRNLLYVAASALIERELASKRSLATLTGGQGYQARVTDTIALVSWFRSLPSSVRAQTKVTDAELEGAHRTAVSFGAAFAERDQARAGSSAAARDRARMFTLFFRTYERVRQMLTYVRWFEGDVEQIAPSLYANRGTRRSNDDVPAPTPPAPMPAAPKPVSPVSPDMPGADPFRST